LRASYIPDRVHRHLLKAGERQSLSFTANHLTARRLSAGSRLVMTLGIVKRADREINYGTGQDVSEESLRNSRRHLKLRWYNSSYLEIPVRRTSTVPAR
ncbi:MAG: acylase, partial [Pseudomonadota bacterium]|nr:acylase [Pseudomonadota bacterium]